jgi:dTDP-4-dehydrorhamnose reductase
MRILVTGSKGMLGQTLVPTLEKCGHKVTGTDVDTLDITDFRSVSKAVQELQPELIVHGAAYTAVDQAESDQAIAFRVNGYGTENLAVACNKLDIPMLYISTDYVFDGENDKPYQPLDQTCPISVYGKSKLAGEVAVRNHLNKFYIVRTSWLYGPHGKNFVETMLELAKDRKQLKVVADQTGSPTSTVSLAGIVSDLIETERWGVYHGTDGGVTTWYDFAREILKGVDVEVIPCETKDFPRPAPRPRYSVLDKTSLTSTLGRDVVPWETALQKYMTNRLEMQPA